VARFVSGFVEGDLALAISFSGYHRPRALLADQRPQFVGVIPFIAEDIFGAFELIQKVGGCFDVMDIAWREQKAERAADYIGEGMNFGRVAPTRAPDLLFFLPVGVPPNAERWTLIEVESMATFWVVAPACASASSIAVQNRLRDQRLKRL
jgi:hypothetical protein